MSARKRSDRVAISACRRSGGRVEYNRTSTGRGSPMFCFLVGLIVLAFVCIASSTFARENTVTLYCTQDQVYGEPIVREFLRQSEIKVLPLYDSEAVKTVGLANRLLAEKSHPRCDVYWGNEELRTRQLAAQGIFRETNGWKAIGYRSRRIVINTNLVSLERAPHSLMELTNTQWRGRVALAYPLFGTTATHFLALRSHWGPARWETWTRALAANEPFLVDGNSIVVKFVGRGEAWIGLTDSDDIAAGQRAGLPVAALPLTEEMLLIPNTIAIIRGAPKPGNAQRLFDYLQTPDVLQRLISAHALEGASMEEVTTPTLKPAWDHILRDLDAGTRFLREIFLR